MLLDICGQSSFTQLPLSFARSKKMKTEDEMGLAERIRVVMRAMEGPDRGKQVRLAKIADTSKQVVNHWLTGVTQEIAYPQAKNICEELGFRLEWLMNGRGPVRVEDVEDTSTNTDKMLLQFLTQQEAELISDFRQLNELGRAIVTATIKGAPKE